MPEKKLYLLQLAAIHSPATSATVQPLTKNELFPMRLIAPWMKPKWAIFSSIPILSLQGIQSV